LELDKKTLVDNLDGEYMVVKGTKIRYIVKGSGSPVLLIHGFGQFLEVWWFNIGPLSQHYQVYAMDLPGHGLSEKPAVDYTFSIVTEFIIDFMEALGIGHASLIGHSMGGSICLDEAINFPDKVDRIILVDSGSLSEKVPLLYRLCALPILGDILVRPTIKAGVRSRIKRTFYNPDLVTEDMVNLSYELLRKPGVKATMLSIIRGGVSISRSNPETIVTDKLRLVKVPTLLIHGAQDTVIPLEYAQNACRLIPDCRLEIIDECGHCPHLEKASEFNEAVISFLGG
jgi:4,5:9,10-diseco-3-hydroxy-5,9,17-trioxoandrosta-1(10),2-diene-4-oate hydrolase